MYSIVDQETGEVVAQNFIFFGRPNRALDKGYIKVFVAFLDSALEDDQIAGKAIRLLFYLMKNMEYNNPIVKIIPRYAIRELGISKKTFYIWLKVLEEKSFVRRIDTYTYEINPYHFVKGQSGKAMENLIDETTERYKEQKTKKTETQKTKNKKKKGGK